jgi:hypothetical protein
MLPFLLLTVGFFLLFVVLLFIGISQKKRKPIYIGLIFFLLAIPSGLYTSFLFAQKAYEKIKTAKIENPLKRSGIAIYTAVLDEPTANCVTVINSQDAYIPKIDCCIWLEFITCPKELARIIAKKELKPVGSETHYQGDSSVAVITENSIPDYSPKPQWFVPENLGAGYKTLRKYNADDPNHDLILYFSKDSTRAYYCDMAE